jgi:hypothetical protein
MHVYWTYHELANVSREFTLGSNSSQERIPATSDERNMEKGRVERCDTSSAASNANRVGDWRSTWWRVASRDDSRSFSGHPF